MSGSLRLPFREMNPSIGNASALPYAPVELELRGTRLIVDGLLDTGATLSVLPFDVGRQLGAIWDQQTISVKLTGNLAQSEAKALLVNATIGQFPAVRLAFAWTKNNQIPVILGQINFFLEFDVCFFRSQEVFEISPTTSS